jgi:hypothetical protein
MSRLFVVDEYIFGTGYWSASALILSTLRATLPRFLIDNLLSLSTRKIRLPENPFSSFMILIIDVIFVDVAFTYYMSI